MIDRDEGPERVSQLKRDGFTILTNFGSGGLNEMSRLISRIKSVLSSLEVSSDDSWVRDARRQWGQLEILYSLLLEEGRVTLTDEERADTEAIVASLTVLFRP